MTTQRIISQPKKRIYRDPLKVQDEPAVIEPVKLPEPKVLTAEEAKVRGYNLQPDWSLRVGNNGDGDTIVSPDKWEFRNFTYGEAGEVQDYVAFSPEGKQFTRVELEQFEKQPKTLEEVQALDKEFKDLLERSYVSKDLEERKQISTRISEIEVLLRDTSQVPVPTLEESANKLDLEVAISKLYPDMLTIYEGETDTIDDKVKQVIERIGQVAQRNPQELIQEIVSKGDRVSGEAILKQFFEVTPEDIENLPWRTPAGEAVSYDPLKLEMTATPPETKAKDIWDAAVFSAASIWNRSKQYFVSALPNLLFRDMTALERKIQGDAWADESNKRNRILRDQFRQIYARNNEEFETWVQKNPELMPPEWAEGDILTRLKQNPAATIAYEVASAAPFMLGIMGTTLAVTAATGNPVVGLAAGVAVATPAQTQDVYEAVLSAGGTEEQATGLSALIGPLISSVEVVGDLPFLKAVMPSFFRFFKKEATEQVAKATVKQLVKKGIVTAGKVELAETMEEVVQGALQNAAVKVVDEHQNIFEGVTDTAIRAALATAPLAAFGGGAAGIGLEQRTREAIQFAKEQPERGAIGREPEEVTPAPEVTELNITTETQANALPVAGDTVGGLVVRKEIPNQDSIESTLDDWEVLSGIREIPTSSTGEITQPKFYSVEQEETTRALAEEIKASGEINPLIVVVESTGDYILEGVHRLDALRILGIKSFPAQIVINRESLPEVTPPVTEAGMPEAPAVEEVKPPPAVTEELPTAINKIREEHNQVRSDVAAIRASLKGKTDIGSRMTRQVLVGTERELSIADRILSTVETKEELASERITQLQERVKASINLAKARTEQVQNYKQALTDFVKTLPLNVRGKMLASVKNVRTEQGLENAANKAIDLAEQHNQKVLTTEVRKEVKRTQAKVKDHILKGKFTPDVQRRLDVLNHNLDMDRDVARDKMAENIAKFESGELSYEEMTEANESLNFAGIDGMSAEELANTLDYIKVLRDVGRSERQVKREVETERIKGIREDISNVLTGGKGLKTAVGAVSRRRVAAKPSWLDTFVNWQYGWDSLLDKLSKFDTTSKPFQSAISKFGAVIHRATNRQVAGTKESYEKVKKAVSDAFGVKTVHDLNQVLNGLDEEVNLGTFELTEEYKEKHPNVTTFELKMSRDEMISKYMQMQDPTLNNTFTTGMGWSQKVRDAVEANLSDAEKKLADTMFGFYEDYYQSVNKIYQELYNVDMPHNPKYSPIRRDFQSEVAEQLLTFQDAAQYASVLNGSLKARQKNIRPLKFNGATRILSNHIEQMEHFKAWATTMRDLRRVFGNKEIRQAIEEYHGTGITRLIDKFMNDMARGGIETAATNRGADYLRRAFTKSILAIKPVIMLKQIPSLFAYTSEMKTTDFFAGIADFWKAPTANFKFLYQNSEMFKNRISAGFERDIRAAMEKHGKKAISGQGKFTDWFLLQIRAGDVFAVTQGMWAKYKAGLKAGLSQAEAIAAAEDTTGRTQPTFGIDTLSAIQNGGSFLKLMTMFQNQPNKYFRIMGDNLRNFKYGRGSRAKAASTMLLVWIVLPCIFQWIADAFQWKPEKQLRAGLLGQLNHILIGGQLVQSMTGWLAGENFDWEASPVMATANDIQMAFMKAIKLVNQGVDPYKDIVASDVAALIEYVAEAGGQLAGLPTPYFVQLEKLLRHKFEEGEEVEIKDFLFSQWALEPPKKGVEEKVEEATLELGEVKEGQEDAPLTEKELKVNTTIDWFKKIGEAHSKELPQNVLDKSKASKESKAWAESEIARGQADILPSIPLYQINTEDNNDTIINYYQQWKAREKITSLAKLKEFDKLYPKAHLGNVSRQQYSLLVQYLESEDKDAFLKTHNELKVNLRDEWLKDPKNARGAALLALRGEAKILNKEIYDAFNGLIKELDIPEDAIPELTLPPKESIDTHFRREELVSEGREDSPEGQLLLLQDQIAAEEAGRQSYAEWHVNAEGKGLKVPDKQIDFYQLRVDNKKNYDDLEAAQEADNEEEVKAIRSRKVGDGTFVDVERRVDAISKGTREAPVPPELVNGYVDHMRIVDETSGLSAEAKLNRYDNPALNDFLMNEGYWGKQKAKALDENKEYLDNYLVPRWRFDVKYRTEDTDYNALQTTQDRQGYLEEHGEYRMDRRRRQALEMSNKLTGERFPLDQVENFVQYNEIPIKGKRQERFLVDNPAFAKALSEMGDGIDMPKPEDVPSVQFDDIYDQYKEQFDELEGMSKRGSDYYIEDVRGREARAKALRFTPDGKYTELGLAEVRRNAYGKFVPEARVNDYVEYYTLIGEGKPPNYEEVNKTDLWYDDDWYLIEHPEFYQAVYKELLENQKKDFSKVPTREVFAKYLEYLKLSKAGKIRDDFRWENLDLDNWLVQKFKFVPITEQKRREALTPGEKLTLTIEEMIRRLREHP
uniref:ParB-like N-terminal domain-containing protein n=1 Tax=viral metagenome TaxID=1070528 RepID=A0A6M3XEJ8_9ZZZZ